MKLIDADYADKLAKDMFKGQIGITFYQAIHAMLEAIKPVDAVHVVKCEECKYGIECKFKGELRFQCSQDIPDAMYQPNDFCSKGERKDGEK